MDDMDFDDLIKKMAQEDKTSLPSGVKAKIEFTFTQLRKKRRFNSRVIHHSAIAASIAIVYSIYPLFPRKNGTEYTKAGVKVEKINIKSTGDTLNSSTSYSVTKKERDKYAAEGYIVDPNYTEKNIIDDGLSGCMDWADPSFNRFSSEIIVEGEVVGVMYYTDSIKTRHTKSIVKVFKSFTDKASPGELLTFDQYGGLTTYDDYLKEKDDWEKARLKQTFNNYGNHIKFRDSINDIITMKPGEKVLIFANKYSSNPSDKIYFPCFNVCYTIEGDMLKSPFYMGNEPIKSLPDMEDKIHQALYGG